MLLYLYPVAEYPDLCTAKVLYTSSHADVFIPTPTRLLWEALSHAAISTQMCSFIQLSEPTCHGENEDVHAWLRDSSKGDSNPGSIDCESNILSPSCRAPHINV